MRLPIWFEWHERFQAQLDELLRDGHWAGDPYLEKLKEARLGEANSENRN